MLPEEQAILQKFNEAVTEEVKKWSASGGTTNGHEQIMNAIVPKILESFSVDEKQFFITAQKKLQNVAFGNDSLDTSAIDKKISANVAKVFDHKNDVQLTLYGAAHFSKQHDLDERMQGLNIAIADSTKLNTIRDLFLNDQVNQVHTDLPEYVYYTDKRKMVKLDNDAAKAEFLGLNEQQFRSWSVVREMNIETYNLKEQSQNWISANNLSTLEYTKAVEQMIGGKVDGRIDAGDLIKFKEWAKKQGVDADLNGDNKVDRNDLGYLPPQALEALLDIAAKQKPTQKSNHL